jgi:uroporphyrin-III C-methyltransferase
MSNTNEHQDINASNWPVVALVGAGPGDPELLTIKALKAIQAATVVLVDDLVSPEICALIPQSCRQIFVGKRGGCQSTPQAFIEKLMIQCAKEGERVVRLKGGDPCIFGRAGEEIEALRASQVNAIVINGITSGLAAMSSLGLSLTHRQHAHGVVFVTGHAKEGKSGVRWGDLGQVAQSSKLTLIVYMGMSLIEKIQKGLLEGLPPQTAVAVVEKASTRDQRHLITSLGQLIQDVQSQFFKSPSVIVVGDVIKGLEALEENSKACTPESLSIETLATTLKSI